MARPRVVQVEAASEGAEAERIEAMNLRSALYFVARRLGDANAIAKGKIVQRVARVYTLRKTGGWINRLFK